MKKVLVAPDKFRGSLTAFEVAHTIKNAILQMFPDTEVIMCPLADGGEQTSILLTEATGGVFVTLQVQDPLFRPVEATYGLSADGTTAFIEMATASGLELLTNSERNPLLTTTIGTGQMIVDALERGATQIILCIGGSATNDAGMGMAQALGYRFLGSNQQELLLIGQNLVNINAIDDSQVHPLLGQATITVACDVTNPLFGPSGAAQVYAPQKGADSNIVVQLDAGLAHFANVIHQKYKLDLQQIPGGGAAGGLGAGCVAFLGATLRSGIVTVMDALHFDESLSGADLVITGEGKIDLQTLSGKVVQGVTQKAVERQIPVIAFCGTLDLTAAQLQTLGVSYATSIIDRPMTLSEAQTNAVTLLGQSVERLMRLLKLQ